MTEWKQPHQDVTGVDRDDALLSLDDSATAHREALIGLGRNFYRACLVGNPAPIVTEMYDRMKNPQPGDLVMETGAPYSQVKTRALGILLEHRREWWHTDEEWAEVQTNYSDPDDERPTDAAWYIQYGPKAADVCRWTDAEFIALPIDGRQFA